MSQRQKKKALVQSAIDQVADPNRRRALAEHAAETASQLATDLAKKSADLGSQLSVRAGDVAHVVSTEGQTFLKEHAADLWKAQKEAQQRASAAAKVEEKSTARKAKKVRKNVKKDAIEKKPRKHRLRKALLLSGAGAVAAYFLDPDNGAQRRFAARRRTSTSAQAVGDGLSTAADVAHRAAAAAAVAPEPIPGK